MEIHLHSGIISLIRTCQLQNLSEAGLFFNYLPTTSIVMKYVNVIFSLIATVLAGSFSGVQAQGYLHASGTEIVDGSGNPVLLRGMGLGGWMLQEGYMMQSAGAASTQWEMQEKLSTLIGTAGKDAFYDAWLANHVTKRDIDSLAAWGYNSVRLPMHYNLYTLPIQQEPVAGQHTWLTKGFELTDSLLSWCEQNQMYLILDLHAAPGGQGQDAAISDYNPSLPSLWESQLNRDKMVALWGRLADRYKNEPWIGGYDLLNEPNWNLPGGTALRTLYDACTQAIRQVDQNHIIFIEGNWFANDFTGLTPPWDNNMVYSFHRYWAFNTKETIQGYLNMRQTYQVPLWMGESGENSNVWFRDCIRLLEDNNIGWAWWTVKKVEGITNPYSIEMPDGYQAILDFWRGQGPQPTAQAATQAMLQLAENAKLENCTPIPGVNDAMFRQVAEDSAIAYKTIGIPGTLYAVDYDQGSQDIAYHDEEIANYSVSSGNYTSWNTGFAFRNDGVDLQANDDPMNNRGYHVGWIGAGEWIQYDVYVATTGVYTMQFRVASGAFGGLIHLEVDGADVTTKIPVNQTGSWESWQSFTAGEAVLEQGHHKLRLFFDNSGYNLGFVNFTVTGNTASVPASFLSATTTGYTTVAVNLNKPMAAPAASPAGLKLFVNGSEVPITAVEAVADNNRLVSLTTSVEFRYGDVIRVSYAGADLQALDGTALQSFTQELVQNNLPSTNAIPGKIQAEAYYFQSGIQLETTSDIGGGQNIGYCDVGDYLDYLVDVKTAGTFQVTYRVASTSTTGKMELKRWDEATQALVSLHSISVPNTGNWQAWTDVSNIVYLPAGVYQLRLEVTGPLFNLNWMDFSFATSIDAPAESQGFLMFPNPSSGQLQISWEDVQVQEVDFSVWSLSGQQLLRESNFPIRNAQPLDLSWLSPGAYLVKLQLADGRSYSKLFTRIP